jgi:glycosyltransferase involved in cell wall biosynthesis
VLDYRPNMDAAEFLVDAIWPLILERCPTARLTIVGRGAPASLRALERPGVTITGEVADVRPYLRDAAVVAVPIRMGGGTRLKVVEGLAMGKPMVSTSLGCEGVRVDDGEHLVIADEPQAFADAVVALFDDPAYGRALGSAGRQRMAQEYSWDSAGERQEALYRRVFARGRDESTGRERVATVELEGRR